MSGPNESLSIIDRLIRLRDKGYDWVGPRTVDTSIPIDEVISELHRLQRFWESPSQRALDQILAGMGPARDLAKQTEYPSDTLRELTQAGQEIENAGTEASDARERAGVEADHEGAPVVAGGGDGVVVTRSAVVGDGAGRPDGPEAVAEIPEG